MPSNQQLKRRISSASNIAQITRAMEAVAASKMRKSQAMAIAGNSYQAALSAMTRSVSRGAEKRSHPFFSHGELTMAAPSLTIIISSDRGLCGPLNSNLFRLLERELDESAPVIAVGKKAREYVRKTGWNAVGVIESVGDYPTYQEIIPASMIAIREFVDHRVGRVFVAYQRFINTLIQQPVMEQLLPIVHEEPDVPEREVPPKYIYEPGRDELLEEILPYSIHLSVYQATLSAKAAEQSARMVAMKNASENARDVRQSLQLVYNKERQKSITAEILDTVTASLALS